MWKLSLSLSFIHPYLGWWNVYSVFTCLKHKHYLINWPVHSFTVTKYTPSKSQNTHWPSRTLPLPCRCLHGSEASVKFYYYQLHFTHSPVKMMLWGHAQKSFPWLHLHWKNIYSCKWYVSLWNQILKSWRKLKIRQKTDDWLWPFFILFALQLRVCQQESRASWSHRCSDSAEAGGESGRCHALERTLIVEKGDKLTRSGVFSVWERGVIMESVKYIMWEGVL